MRPVVTSCLLVFSPNSSAIMALLRSSFFVKNLLGTVRYRTFQYASADAGMRSMAAVVAHRYSTKSQSKVVNLDDSLKQLEDSARYRQSVTRYDVNILLEAVKNETINSAQSVKAIMYFGQLLIKEIPEVRTNLAKQLWKVLESRNSTDISHYNALLGVYVENEHPFKMDDVLADLESKGLTANRATYQRIIENYSQFGDLNGIADVIEIMKSNDIPLNVNIYNALIFAYGAAGEIDAAKGFIETMKNEGVNVTRESYIALLRAYAKLGNLDSCLAEIGRLKEQEIILSDKDVLDLIYEFACSGHAAHCQQLLDNIPKSSQYNRLAVNIITRLLHKNQDDVAFSVLKTMTARTTESGVVADSGDFYIKQLIRLKRPSADIVATCAKMKEEQLHSSPLSIWRQSSGRLSPEEALTSLRESKAQNTPLVVEDFRPLFQSNDTDAIGSLRAMIEEFEVKPTSEFIREVVVPRMDLGRPTEIMAALTSLNIPVAHTAIAIALNCLRRNQIEDAAIFLTHYKLFPNPLVFRGPLISALKATGDVKHYLVCLRSLYDQYFSALGKKEGASEESLANERNDALGGIVFNTLIRLDPDTRISTINAILKGLVSQGLTISRRSGERIAEELRPHATPKNLKHLSQLTSGELVPIPLERKSFRIQPTSANLEYILSNGKARDPQNVQFSLLMAYHRENKLGSFEEFLQKLENENAAISNFIYAKWVDLKIGSGDLTGALQTTEQVREKRPDFFVFKDTTIKIAAAFIDNNQFDEALAFFEKNKYEKTSLKNQKVCCELLNKVAASNPDYLQRFLECLLQNNHLQLHPNALIPLIRIHLEKNDTNQTVDTFVRFAQEYNMTPLSHEICTHLIKTEDLTNLQKVVDACAMVHGEQNSLINLAFVFVECDRLEQARNIFEMPQLKVNSNRMVYYLEKYVKRDDVHSLESLVEATRNINRIDRSEILEHLLTVYCQKEATEKALELWITMQEQGEAPTNAFMLKLGEYLKSKGFNVPFVMPDADTVQQEKRTAEQNVQPSSPGLRNLAAALKVEGDNANLIRQTFRELAVSEDIGEAVKTNKQYRKLLNAFALDGDVQMVEKIGKYSVDVPYKKSAYSDYLARAFIQAGRVDELFEKWTQALDAATTEKELLELDHQFPEAAFSEILHKNIELLPACEAVAKKFFEKGVRKPINAIWCYLVISKNTDASDRLWNEYLQSSPSLFYHPITYKVKDEVPILQLINYLKASENHKKRLNGAYTALLDFHTSKGDFEKGLQLLDEIAGSISLEAISAAALKRLKAGVEAAGQTFPYEIKEQANDTNTKRRYRYRRF